jgi:hypothetical protein
MTEQLYLHVGAPKSGTTYLQRILETNRTALEAAGVLLVGRRHLDRVHAAMAVREDPRLDDLGPQARTAWRRLAEQVRTSHLPKAILSYELFAGASAEQARRALGDLQGIDVHLVVTARDFAKAVPSAWQERLKFALTTPLEDWTPPPESAGPRAEWGWRTMDPAGVASRWAADLPPDRVHIVTVPAADGAAKDELWRRFAEACRLDVPGLDLRLDRTNESLGLVGAELLRRVNERVTAPIDTSREQAVWLRDTLAHAVLAPLGREPIGVTDDQFAEAVARSDACIARISAAGYRVHGDLEDLRASRPGGRTPSQATESELLDTAVAAIVELLLQVRQRSRAEVPGTGGRRSLVRTAGKRLLQRAAAPGIRRETARLEARLAAVQSELQEQRALQLRVAELTDLVAELLMPAGDGQVSQRALEDYREQSL